MRRIVASIVLGLALCPIASAENMSLEAINAAQVEAYKFGQTDRPDTPTQEQVLTCAAYWEGYADVLFEQGEDLIIQTLTADKVYGYVDHWQARLEISDDDAYDAAMEEMYLAFIYYATTNEKKIAGARKLGACAP